MVELKEFTKERTYTKEQLDLRLKIEGLKK